MCRLNNVLKISNFVIEGRRVFGISAFLCSLLDTSREKNGMGTVREKENNKTVTNLLPWNKPCLCEMSGSAQKHFWQTRWTEHNGTQGQAEPVLHYIMYWKSIKGSTEGDALSLDIFLQIYSHSCLYKQKSFKIIVTFPSKCFTLVKLFFVLLIRIMSWFQLGQSYFPS